MRGKERTTEGLHSLDLLSAAATVPKVQLTRRVYHPNQRLLETAKSGLT